MVNEKVFLVGLPASGKTTYAEKLAQRIGLPFFDLDKEIENSTGQSISEIFNTRGEDGFRLLEKEQLKRVTKENHQFVLATGGGTPCFFDNMSFMNENGLTVYLNPPIEEISDRLKNDTSRPLMKTATINELYSARHAFYERAQKTAGNFEELINLF